jgi:molybdenum cofactor synthesis domain-containing protein
MQEVMKAAILITGNEILSGSTQDLNVQYIARHLSELGILLAEVRMVRDIEGDIIYAVNELRSKYDYVFTTGGIGPTHDDITAGSIAKAFGVPLERNAKAVELMKEHSIKIERVMHEASYKMADMPKTAELILNEASGAPGFKVENVYVMAGIPNIMQAMFNYLIPQLKAGKKFISKKVTAHAGESMIAKILEDINIEYKDLDLGSYPFQRDGKWGTNLVIRGQNTERVEEALKKLESELELAKIEFTNVSDK